MSKWFDKLKHHAGRADAFLGGSTLKVLTIILAYQQRGESHKITSRLLAERLGCAVHNVYVNLVRLQRHGLISFEPDRDGTIRAHCSMTLYPEAFEEKPGASQE